MLPRTEHRHRHLDMRPIIAQRLNRLPSRNPPIQRQRNRRRILRRRTPGNRDEKSPRITLGENPGAAGAALAAASRRAASAGCVMFSGSFTTSSARAL